MQHEDSRPGTNRHAGGGLAAERNASPAGQRIRIGHRFPDQFDGGQPRRGNPGGRPFPAATAAAKPSRGRSPRRQEHLTTAGREKSASAPNPTTWEQRKLGDVAEIVGGGTPDTNNVDYWDGVIDWYSPAELGTQIYVDGSARRITEAGYANSSAKMLPAERTILFTSRAGIGTAAILRRPACTNQGFQSIVVGDEADVYFLFSMTDHIKKCAEQKAAGSTFLEVSGKQLAAIDLKLPALSEQRKIGSLFQSLDSLITLHQRKHENVWHQNGAWNGLTNPLVFRTPLAASSPPVHPGIRPDGSDFRLCPGTPPRPNLPNVLSLCGRCPAPLGVNDLSRDAMPIA